ncbi:proteasome assembly chaperone 4-like [Pollicipes pollicipes]|uniref:proteasome assembly chaperone 4-like n=1 Tax=Pollicipes pollicipes TaxID=41117 RepID=UPI0018849708|nr:proteasome assembly chaperone 4-like [Pollicipes pollicipes]XP_037088818.1 proteasome assembly chaperone 4-like [Pollicipes pollicipes]
MVEPPEPRLGTHSFSCRHQETIVHFQVLRLADSFLLWAADAPCFKQLAAGLGASDKLAAKLAQRTGKQVFVSCNVNLDDAALRQAVEARIVEELKEHPDKF